MQKFRIIGIIGVIVISFGLFLPILNSSRLTWYDIPFIILFLGIGLVIIIFSRIKIKKIKSNLEKSKNSQSFESVNEISDKVEQTLCIVCGTIIPEGQNVCPNCGDTYST